MQTQTQTAPVTFPVQFGIPYPFDVDGERAPLVWVDGTVDPARCVYAPDDSPVPVRINLYGFVQEGGKVAADTIHYLTPATLNDVINGAVEFDDTDLDLATRLERCAVPKRDAERSPNLVPADAFPVIFYTDPDGRPAFFFGFVESEVAVD